MTSEPTKRSETQTDIPTYYERKLSWMLGRMFLDSIAWALALVVAFMLRYSVLLNQRSVLDVIDAQHCVGGCLTSGLWPVVQGVPSGP